MIRIENIYYMLSYAFRDLKAEKRKHLGSETFDNAIDLLAAILAKGLNDQIKRGMHKDYKIMADNLKSPRGKINVSTTISKQLMLKKQVFCEYDEYTLDIMMNQILKSTAYLLCRSEDVGMVHKKNLKRCMQYLSDVSYIDLKKVPWKNLRFHGNNTSYRFLMNICYFIADGLLMSEKGSALKLKRFVDDQQVSRLYEKFLLEYFRKHYSQFKVSASFIDWQTDDGKIDLLPQMKSDVTIEYNGMTMIIDAKYYGKSMQSNQFSDRKTILSNNLYQIFTYVKNKDHGSLDKVKGMLLYAKTDEAITPNEKYEMSGNTIYVRTLNLDCDFSSIEAQLDEIAQIIIESAK